MKNTALGKKAVIGLLLLAVACGCGVKSRPLPPLTAPQIGRGEPSLVGNQAEHPQDPKQKKKTTTDDFEDDADF